MAALILTVGSPLVAAGVALAMLAFTVLDIREVTHQLNESHAGLAALAAAIATLHLLAAAAALLTIRHARTRPGASAA
jgi:NO-binding membrane sensor protein with MHYT domain